MPHETAPAPESEQQGLYVPQLETDACGTGFIANLNAQPRHQLVQDALTMLANMHHRGASGCEENTGDGAGILIQLPHAFFHNQTSKHGFNLPAPGHYGAGMVFFPKDPVLRAACRQMLDDYIDELGFDRLGYRLVPTDNSALGASARSTEPCMEQVFVQPRQAYDRKSMERRLFVLRKFAHHNIHRALPQVADDFYIASLSASTIVYKGQLTATQVRGYFPDLQDPDFASAIATIHSRFSTNTVPKWKLAQPFRYIAHNGEINTIQGNVQWWEARESRLQSEFFTPAELEKLKPICGKNLSDSAVFDNVLEFLHLAGRSLPHALMMMIPEAWQHDEAMDDDKRAFYEYHAMLMEPWDGPASVCFTDGTLVGALLDRNGLRPSRFCVLDDGTLIVASEAGALPVAQRKVVSKGRLQPGKILIADLDLGRIVADSEVKDIICKRFSYRDWLDNNTWRLEDLPDADPGAAPQSLPLEQRHRLFGYTREDLEVVLAPMADSGDEPVGSMGADTPLAILSDKPQHLANYFKQHFAQVTNPPIDPIRERAVMSLFSPLGGSKNPLDLYGEHPRCIELDSPVLLNAEFAKLKNLEHPYFRPAILDMVFPADGQKGRLRAALDQLCAEAENAVRQGRHLLILSDRAANAAQAPVPALLATGAVHQHLSRAGLRSHTAIVVESGDTRETHHLATLLGYGANAVNPYLALETIDAQQSASGASDKYAQKYRQACNKGLLKILSKMGVSTVQSYIGAQLFEALGIGPLVLERCFAGTISRIGGLDFDDIASDALAWHGDAFLTETGALLPHGGLYQWQREGEAHLFDPQNIHLLQHAVRTGSFSTYEKYARRIDNQSEKALTLRGLLSFRKGRPIPLGEVEPVESILRRFSTGAMSFGSLSHEAHATLAIAMNRIGAKSNSGEGGEDESRYDRLPNGDSARSAIKQVASGRFGVTSWYLVNADELQIKMAQGAKPGEGGQRPGHKVDAWIAQVRHSTAGVGLISPPPHHDIYSIEDLAQLIFDLKSANDRARISVKLVSKAGVGIIAAGVAKAKADTLLISGHDGGTGASPLSSIRHAGLPWEMGLAETHQTLVRNGLRQRVILQTDGQIRTGRDLAIATLLGAEEWSVATAALVAEGCIMMRKCHLNTCPVGIATQDPELRRRFAGKPEHIIHFFTFLAEDLRRIMAKLGFRSVADMVGCVEMLRERSDLPAGKWQRLDLSRLLFKETAPVYVDTSAPRRVAGLSSDSLLSGRLDTKIGELAARALRLALPYESVFSIHNTDRAVGTLLSAKISRQWRSSGLPEGSIRLHFRGSAGQSFGAFGAKGLELALEGEANDYFGKGLSGARLAVWPDRQAQFNPSENIIIGNVALFGATSGEAYICGQAGERFAVRNSGALAVVEGIGDHGCEYMTGGTVVVLGDTGRNFAAGMTGGTAYVWDPEGRFAQRCNRTNIDLDPPTEAELLSLRQWIRQHFTCTGSGRALELLHDWARFQAFFVKVIPVEYKKVLAGEQKSAAHHAATAANTQGNPALAI
ncbi:MAG: glutamate synthase large subunit [Saprospiraceae bacterium]|nr:glutamate synthase large subunit [Saprospiraceae bacterium]